jgi:hypothetical protein
VVEGLRKWVSGVQPVDAVLLILKEKLDEILSKVPLLHGQFTDEVQIGTSAIDVPHRLGRIAIGRVLVYQSADARIWDTAKPDGKRFRLQASATTRVRLWVF